MSGPRILVVARAPVAGQAKTRLASTVGDVAAARLAAAALLDTLDVALRTGFDVVVALTGNVCDGEGADELGSMLADCQVIPQRGNRFAERLVNAHAGGDAGHGIVQVGMDTPHLAVADLHTAAQSLKDHDAALGMATDGGWSILALHSGKMAKAIVNVPMSTSRTGHLTRAALRATGATVARLRTMTDVDVWDDALEVARLAPTTRFAAAVADTQIVGSRV